MWKQFTDYFGCPAPAAEQAFAGAESRQQGFFAFGEAVCYGQAGARRPRPEFNGRLDDFWAEEVFRGGDVRLPFDPDQVVENLRGEHYMERGLPRFHRLYYRLRPLLAVSLRKHLQKLYLSRRVSQGFPRWPVERSVDVLMRKLCEAHLRASGRESMPFIWFWPDGASSALALTHDVETLSGRNFCGRLMDIDAEFGMRSIFFVVPEERYAVPRDLLAQMRERGFEIGVQGLNHDGRLFSNRGLFLRRAERIREYMEAFGARGFRSPVLYRNQEWLPEIGADFDMSVPNVARWEAQPGGCCTVLPYFIKDTLELPLTTSQDYTLFNILGDYSIALWKRQIDMIRESHGFISILVHPDYVQKGKAGEAYRMLLEFLCRESEESGLWAALPGDVESWWRTRRGLSLVEENGRYRIAGEGAERARVALARLGDGGVSYELTDSRS